MILNIDKRICQAESDNFPICCLNFFPETNKEIEISHRL